MAGALDLQLVRIELVLDEGARRVDDELLLFRQAEIHGPSPFFLPLPAVLAFFADLPDLSFLVALASFLPAFPAFPAAFAALPEAGA